MLSALREADIVGRLGGDEFLVILNDVTSASHVDLVIQKIQQALGEKFTINGLELSLSASIGVYIHDQGEITAEECINLADRSMYKAKKSNKYKFVT